MVFQVFFCFAPALAEYYESVYARKEKYIPATVLNTIQAFAEKKYPDHGILQQNTIEIQKKAYLKIKEYTDERIPSMDLEMIKRDAARDYPDNFVRQLVTIEKEVTARVKKSGAVSSVSENAEEGR